MILLYGNAKGSEAEVIGHNQVSSPAKKDPDDCRNPPDCGVHERRADMRVALIDVNRPRWNPGPPPCAGPLRGLDAPRMRKASMCRFRVERRAAGSCMRCAAAYVCASLSSFQKRAAVVEPSTSQLQNQQGSQRSARLAQAQVAQL